MPTPRPIRIESCEVKLAIDRTFDSAPIRETAAPSAMPVDRSGSRAGRIEPKTNRSTISAAPTPNIVLLDDEGFVEAATLPSTSTCTAPLFGARAVLTNLVASVVEIACSSFVKVTVAKATEPLALICLAPAGVYGELTDPTFGRRATLASIACTLDW